MLEIGSGTGEHALWFSGAFPHVTWQPTDHSPDNLATIGGWASTEPRTNLLPPLLLDASAPDTWPIRRADAVFSINMIHVAPWSATRGLLTGAARILTPGGPLILYGPFREHGAHTGQGNADFDASLRAENPAWGIRDLQEITALAETEGLRLGARIAMPANNLLLLFQNVPG